jgi:antitoxin VapB
MKAKIFKSGRSQAVRLPKEFRFPGDEVFIRRDPKSGDVVLSRRPNSWDALFELDTLSAVPADFMNQTDRQQGQARSDPFGEAAQ